MIEKEFKVKGVMSIGYLIRKFKFSFVGAQKELDLLAKVATKIQRGIRGNIEYVFYEE
jgi:hypothetical protein